MFKDQTAITLSLATSTAAGELMLVITGSPVLIWQFDAAALQHALVGKDKNTFQNVIKSFEPAIDRAEARVRPFWQGSFPNDPQKITVQIEGL